MRRLCTILALFPLFLAATESHAQEGPRIRPPRALVRQVMRDMDDENDLGAQPEDSVAAGLHVTRRDLNGDGAPELIVEQTRFCGTNCTKWIYRRLPDGGYRMLLTDVVINLNVLPARSHGWHSIATWHHSSCCEGSSDLYEFDGTRYRWRELKWQRERNPRTGDTTTVTVYRLSIDPPGTARRRLRLDAVTAPNGVRVDAGYDVCRVQARCGEPWLRLSSPRLPAGRVCVDMRRSMDQPGTPVPRSSRECGVTAESRQGGRATRTLLLHPTRSEWGTLQVAWQVMMTIPGVPGDTGPDVAHAVQAFAGVLGRYYRVVCPGGYGCSTPDDR